MTSLTCRIYKEIIQVNLLTKQRLTDLENALMVVRGKRVREFGMDMYGRVGWTHYI